MAGASASHKLPETQCHCCGQWSQPERVEVRADPAHRGRLRVVEVAGQGLGTHVVTHQRGLCCARHALGVRDVLAAQRDRTRAATHAALAEVYGWACGSEVPSGQETEHG